MGYQGALLQLLSYEVLYYMFYSSTLTALLLRGLDVLSTEESVLQGIQHAGSDLPIRSVRIGRDPLTNTSRGVCYIELNSVLDSMQLHNKLAHSPPTIDNKQVSFTCFYYSFWSYISGVF